MSEIKKAARVTRVEGPDATVRIGEWYWREVSHDSYDRIGPDGRKFDLVCVTHVGSNYVEVSDVARNTKRVHFNKFDQTLQPAPDARSFVGCKIAEHQTNTNQLLDEVRALTMQLAINAVPNETQALSVRRGEPIGDYKKALVKAKDKTLPKLFEQIKNSNEQSAMWMKAELLPMRAQAESLRPIIETIEGRIFNVELYAGLVEQVVQIQDGDPAQLSEPIRLFQRRYYMDEESLLSYTSGGLRFHGIKGFDRWLLQPEQLNRLLPFSRCIASFQVRRNLNDETHGHLYSYISFDDESKLDKATFLYIRNGQQVYRLRTGIEFGPRLFPDVDQTRLLDGSVIWAKYFTGVEDELITDAHYQELRTAYIGKPMSGFRGDKPSTKKEQATRLAEIEKSEAAFKPVNIGFYSYVQFDQRSAYYDDIRDVVNAQIEQHNRVVMILQGLLDRSQVFQPHPYWKLWEVEGFTQALVLLYDDTRALSPTEAPPDFEAYRARLNKSLAVGSVTIGQADAWEEREAARENKRQRNDWRIRQASQYTRFTPYGDPGPGRFARVWQLTANACTYRWSKERRRRERWGSRDDINKRVKVLRGRVLNADAYTPGDFKQFFADPRTRADYLKWAPLLLECEEYKAGNRDVSGDPPRRNRHKKEEE